jgi:hypothetical protein
VTGLANGATGHVKSIPKGLDVSGAGEQTRVFTQLDVKLSAEPQGRHARAVFSLDDCDPTVEQCGATGAYGEDVGFKLMLHRDRSVTVTNECQPGFACTLRQQATRASVYGRWWTSSR